MILFNIASNTYKEIIRDRVLYGLVVFAVLLIFLSLLLGDLSFVEQERIITDLGLVAAQIGCCMLALFVGSSLVWREIDRQTVLTLLSKPVSRSQFILGKFLGLGLVLVLVNLAMSLLLAGVCYWFGSPHWVQFFFAELGVLLESTFILSVSLFFGVFCRPIMATMFSLCTWLIGHGINDLHYFSNRSHSIFVKYFGLGVSRVFPNLSYFDFKEAVIYGDPITTLSLMRASGIWIAWLIILLISSMWIFERRDFT